MFVLVMLDEFAPPHDAATLQALAHLDRLSAIGMQGAERLSDILHTASNAEVVGIVNALTRLAKAVRMTVMLRARLACEGLVGAAAADAARRRARAERPAASAGLAPDPGEAIEREERFDHGMGWERGDRPERFDDLTVDEALSAIAKGLGLEKPIDLTADVASLSMPDLDAIFAAAGSGRRRSRGVLRKPLQAHPP